MPRLFVEDDIEPEQLPENYEQSIEISSKAPMEASKQDETEEDPEATIYPLIPEGADEESYKPDINDIRGIQLQMTLPLRFQQQIIETLLVTEDPLLILGRGLGLSNIISNLLNILATPTCINGKRKRSLVLVLNASSRDNIQIAEQIQELVWATNTGDLEKSDIENGVNSSFSIVTADSHSVDNRSKLYSYGGIVSVTSRILIADLLAGVVSPNRITGLVVLNVEELKAHSNESFILEMYRSINNWGFIKGFSESPESYTTEFSPLFSRMKDLRLKSISLWPRFRVEISSCLNKATCNGNDNIDKRTKVIEVKVSLTESMSQIQYGIMECLNKCIAELNRKNPELASDWWTVDNVLDANFINSINSTLMPNWHRVSYETKQLVKDIRFLKHLLKLLITADAVDFYEQVQLSLEANKPSVTRKYSESPWLLVEESQVVISHARKRIFSHGEYNLEEMPKWEQLISLLDDIAHEHSVKHCQGPTLVLCSDAANVAQISAIIRNSNKQTGFKQQLLYKLQRYKDMREERKHFMREVKTDFPNSDLIVSTSFAKEHIQSKRRRTRGDSVVAAVSRLRTAGSGDDIEGAIDVFDVDAELSLVKNDFDDPVVSEEPYIVVPDDDLQYPNINVDSAQHISEDEIRTTTDDLWIERTERCGYIDSSSQIIIERFSDIHDTYLQERRPAHILLLEPNLTFIRRVEMYQALNKESPAKVYFMYYAESVEEQSLLLAIKKEKDAFTKLIRENSRLAQVFETKEDLSHFRNLANRQMKLRRMKKNDTRNAGGQSALEKYTTDLVIVDSREFNASLPGLLYRYGVRVIPCMLTVGDYILSPDICIERKSISDLIGSLQNNRLESQCKKMVKYYKYPTLLIEFDEHQSFSLEPFSERRNYRRTETSTLHPISNKLSQDEIQLQLSKIVMKFPTLKIIWSSSPLQTVNIILEVKLGREQPDPNVAQAIGFQSKAKKVVSEKRKLDPNGDSDRLTKLLKIPGVSKIDYFNIRKKIKTFDRLRKLTYENLTEILIDETLVAKVNDFVRGEEEEILLQEELEE